MSIQEEITKLLATPRCKTVSMDSNAQLAKAVDKAFFSPSQESLDKLKAAIAADK